MSESDAPIQLYSLATPNGQKIGIALEEMGIPYEAHTINIMKGEQFSDEFVKINPNSKIPAIVDPTGDDGKPLAIFESGAILVYLAEKTGKFLPKDPAGRARTLSWLCFQVGGLGPMLGQAGHFVRYAKERVEYGVARYGAESKRLLAVLDKHLATNQYLAGSEYTIADMATFPWVKILYNRPEDDEIVRLVDLHSLPNLRRYVDEISEREAVKRGLGVTPFPSSSS